MKNIVEQFSPKEIDSAHRLMLMIVLAIGILNYFWGEKVLAGGGFGWDGVNYANMAQNLFEIIKNGQLSHYYAQRILPSAVVHTVLFSFGLPGTDGNVINVFELYNLTLIAISCWIWKLIANNLSLSLAGRWIGFSGLFINFECSKQAFYNPVLTDVTALFIAILLLFFYLEKKAIRLFCVTLLGAFCWPVVSVSGALLLIYMRSDLSPTSINRLAQDAFSSKLTRRLIAIGLFLIFSALFWFAFVFVVHSLSVDVCGLFNSKFTELLRRLPISNNLYLSLVTNNNYNCVLENFLIKSSQTLTSFPSLYIFSIALVMLIGSKNFVKESILNLLKVKPYLILLALASILVPALLVDLISNKNIPNASSLGLLTKITLLPPEGKILLPFVTLTSFWGPIILLLIFNWPEFCIKARLLGAGVVGVIAISIILGLANEPRFLTIGWPFIVLGVVMMLEGISLGNSFKYFLLVLTIFCAQFWLRLNYEPWTTSDYEGLLEFPKQLYFMHYGLWMSWGPYIVQLFIFIISGIFLKYFLDKRVDKAIN